jgi:hypothetical protein
MDDNRERDDRLFREEVLRARAMDPAEKLSAGFELFEYACEITRAGIRNQNPQADEAEVERILGERLALAKRLEIGQWKPRK